MNSIPCKMSDASSVFQNAGPSIEMTDESTEAERQVRSMPFIASQRIKLRLVFLGLAVWLTLAIAENFLVTESLWCCLLIGGLVYAKYRIDPLRSTRAGDDATD